MAQEFKITSIRLRELEQELNHLKTTREKEVSELIKEARSFGDLSENSEYDAALNEQAKLYARIADIENIMANAIVIDEVNDEQGVVSLGATIKVKDLDLDEIEIYTIVGSQEADPDLGRISDDSPFGRACMGKRIGDIVEYPALACVVRYEILGVEK